MKKIILKTLRFALFLSIGIILLYFAFRGIDLKKLGAQFLNAKYIWIIFSLVFLTISHFLRAYRWNLLIEAMHYKPSLIHTFYSVMVGYLANFAFPRIGEITKCGALAKTEKIPVDKLLGTVIIERTTDVMTLFVFMVILITARLEFFNGFIKPQIFDPLGKVLAPLFATSVLVWIPVVGVPFILLFLAYRCRARFAKWMFFRKTKDFIKGILTGLKTAYMMKKGFQFIFFSILIWVFYWMMTFVTFFALSSTSELKMIDGLFILVIGGFAFVVPVQGGIGTFHWIVSLGLTLYGISREEGLAFATIIHGSQSLWTIILGSVSMVVLVSINRRKKMKLLNSNKFIHEYVSKPAEENPAKNRA